MLTPAEFHNTVNVVFHDVEASHYDAIHAGMWESLGEQINLLVNDLENSGQLPLRDLRLLDIGCGTGLSTELLLKTPLGRQITDITLLDTSPNMLMHAEEKAKKWGKKYSLSNSDVNALRGTYDVIIVSSVLHHIPDLEQFLTKISGLQNQDGIFIHMQDPNGDYMADETYAKRAEEYDGIQKKGISLKKQLFSLVPKSIKREANKLLGRKNYIDFVNEKLIEKKAIKHAMTPEEIWSVTDIHVENLPFSIGSGISMKFIKEVLDGYSLTSMRSYGFYGLLKSELEPEYQKKEQALIAVKELNGRHVSGVWIKK